jgi:hypothetical protein
MEDWEVLDVFNTTTQLMEQVPIGERDLYRARRSKYYPRWAQILVLSRCRTKDQGWELLSYAHQTMDDMRAFKSGKNSESAMRAIKASIIDWTARGLIGSGCVINRRFA